VERSIARHGAVTERPQDRLIPLWIATQAVRQQTRTVEFESASQILHEWGLAQNGAHYRRLADGFRRIFASTIFFGTSEATSRAEVWECGRLHFFERMRLWFRPESSPPQTGQRNLVTLSEAFWEEIRTHPVPIDAEVVRALANNPGCLDLYVAVLAVLPGANGGTDSAVWGIRPGDPAGCPRLCAKAKVPREGSSLVGTRETVLVRVPGHRLSERSASGIGTCRRTPSGFELSCEK